MPLQKRRNIQSLENFAHQCDRYAKCNDKEFRSCHCDDRCIHFGDCCPEISAASTQRVQDKRVHNDVRLRGRFTNANIQRLQDKQVHNGIPSRELFTCAKYNRFNVDYLGIFVISRCPDPNIECFDGNSSFDIGNMLYVTDKKNITYRNSKCAECNGVFDYSFWDASFPMPFLSEDISQCTGVDGEGKIINRTVNLKTETDAGILLQHGCKMETYPPFGRSLRFCTRNPREVDNCSTEFSPVRIENMVFRNKDCCEMQTGVCSSRATCFFWKYTEDYTTPWEGTAGRFERLPSSVLFRFSEVCNNKLIKKWRVFLDFH